MTPRSFITLGFYFCVRFVARLFSRSGKRRFLANYGTEGLVPMGVKDRAVAAEFSRCIACGLCDEVAAQRTRLRTKPSEFVRCHTRNLPDFMLLEEAIADMNALPLAELEAVCPTRVPIRALVDFAQRHSDDIRRETQSVRRLPVAR